MKPNNELKPINEVLSELLTAQAMTEEKLAKMTDIPVYFVEALKNAEYSKLPAKAYVRGYLTKIADALAVEPATLLDAYARVVDIKTAGARDRLPHNRFAASMQSRNKIVLGIIAAVVLGVIGFRFFVIIGKPTLSISLPEGTYATAEENLTIRGAVKAGDSVAINNEAVPVSADGSFAKELLLAPGLNVIECKVDRFLGQETKVVREVVFEKKEIEVIKNEKNQIGEGGGETKGVGKGQQGQ